MNEITAITVQAKNKERCNLFIDGEFAIGLSMESVVKNRLKVGQTITKDQLDAIVNESEKQDALNKALLYVSKTLKTKRQVKDYLLRKGYDEETAWQCIDKLKEYNYINDEEYAKRYLESTSKRQGSRLSEYKLMSKGIKKEDIESANSKVDIPHKDNAKSLAEKYMKNKENTKENVLKTYRYLISRGFSYEEAEYAVSSFKEDN